MCVYDAPPTHFSFYTDITEQRICFRPAYKIITHNCNRLRKKTNLCGQYCRKESRMQIQPASWGCGPANWQVQRSSRTPAGPGWGATWWPPPCASLQNTQMHIHGYCASGLLQCLHYRSAGFKIAAECNHLQKPSREPLVFIDSRVWTSTCSMLRLA